MKLFTLFALFTTSLLAAPALGIWHTYTQSDGTTFTAKPQGNEYLHFLKTKEGAILLYNPKTKNFDYATVQNDRLTPSNIPYMPKEKKLRKSASFSNKPTLTPKQLEELYKKAKERFHHHR